MKLEAMDVLLRRRSIRSYKPDQVSEELLDLVLKAGTFAPTGGGAQSPLIVVVRDKETIEWLSKMNAVIAGRDGDPYYGAPTIILVFADQERPTFVEDGSSVLTAMQYAAFSVGLGSCWIHRERQMFETDEGREYMKKWGVGDNFVGVGSLAIGYTEGPMPEPKPRKEGYIIKV